VSALKTEIHEPAAGAPVVSPANRRASLARSLPARILVGAVAAVLAYLLRSLIVHFTGPLPPFLVFMPTVILVALSLGVWAGLTVTFVSALLVDYFLLPPFQSFRLAHSSDVFVVFHFTAVGIFTSVLSELYRRKNDRIARLQTAEAVRAERLITAEHAAANVRLEDQAARLRETEQLLTTLVTFVPEILWMCTPQGDNIYFNQRWVEYTGLTPEESAGTNWTRPFHPEDAPAAREAWAEAVRSGSDYQVEARLRGAGGDYRWFLLRATPIRSEDGAVQRWLGSATDIDDLKRADEELRLTQQRFEMAIRPTPVSVFNQDRDLRMTWVYNAAAGYDGAVLLGKRDRDIVERPEDAVAIEAIKQRAIETGELQRAEVTAHLSGVPRIYDMVVAPLRDAAGNITGITCATIDITERKREITDLQRAHEALIKSEKLAAVGRLASSIAHEINNPLEAVNNILYLARTSPECPESVIEFLLMAEEELQRVAHVTRQTLGFYRETVSPRKVPLDQILDSAADLHRRKAVERKAIVRKQYRGDFHVTAIPGELRQVFSNLLANSLDAIEDGGTVVLRTSRCTSRSGQPHLRVIVADNGSGISPEIQERIFEPLFTTKVATGSGLGLWVVRQIVDKHGGSIAVRSRTAGPYQGTSFVVTLPDLNDG